MPGLTLWSCQECGFVFSDRRNKAFDPKALYESFYGGNEIVGRFLSPVETAVRLFRLFRAFKMWTIAPRAKSILDIGSGRGFMLYYLKRFFGFRRAAGTQISRAAFEFSRDRLGLEMYPDDLLECRLEAGRFDMVTLWHVLEHVADPERYLEEIHRLLAPGGRLVVEVPNFRSWTRAYTGRDWLGLDPDYHTHFFTPEALSAVLEKHGFKVRRVHTFSLEYSAFISTQSLLSKWTRTPHLVFRSLQTAGANPRGPGAAAKREAPAGAGRTWPLFIALFPFCLAINLLLFGTKRGEVLLIAADAPNGGSG